MNVTGQTGLTASTRGMFNRASAHKLALAKFPFIPAKLTLAFTLLNTLQITQLVFSRALDQELRGNGFKSLFGYYFCHPIMVSCMH